jgi:hypothetical protein
MRACGPANLDRHLKRALLKGGRANRVDSAAVGLDTPDGFEKAGYDSVPPGTSITSS